MKSVTIKEIGSPILCPDCKTSNKKSMVEVYEQTGIETVLTADSNVSHYDKDGNKQKHAVSKLITKDAECSNGHKFKVKRKVTII